MIVTTLLIIAGVLTTAAAITLFMFKKWLNNNIDK